MAPLPQEHTCELTNGCVPSEILESEQIVVSGMSGLYPESRNIKEFSENLYNKVNTITPTNERWNMKHPELCHSTGRVAGLDRFDAQFFKVHYKMGLSMDPMARKLLELAFEAIYDAGLNPADLTTKRVGVFIASSISETESILYNGDIKQGGFGIAGCSKTMYANRISYWLDTKGPSVTIDNGCCSAAAALEQAFLAIRRGECDTAIVGGAHINLLPQTVVNIKRCIGLAPDGKTKSFAENADGCAASDAINVILLQKASDALRNYAEVVHVKTEFVSRIGGETGQVFGFDRDPTVYSSFLKQFYDEARVSPDAVEYVEAFGSAKPSADKTELQVIDNVFCGNRRDPLKVGSVMSNIGYTGANTGLAAMTKVLIAYHNRLIASNMHYDKPRSDVAALNEGRIQIVTKNQPIQSSYIGINGLSVAGINSHILLHGHWKPKDSFRYKSSIPRLVLISSRVETSLPKIFEDLKSRPIVPEEIALLHNIHRKEISGHLGRGYIILDTDSEGKTRSLVEKAEYINTAQQPLWFVYSGMGSQWSGMGAALMRIPIFSAAIERCHRVLKPKGIDIVHIITSPDKTMFNNILYSFVGIAAIQIGLTDILKELGLEPDKIIGHSVGEVGCAYADGCMTAEQTILSAYSRGQVSLENKLISGAMAAVGVGYQKISEICPPEIEVACHNGPESCTISGPAAKITEFVEELTAKGIFAKEVPCANIAYHSTYIAPAGPFLLKYLSELIKNPKPRSGKWLSTSVPQEKWDQPSAKYCSAEYLTNNLLSPVLFEETCRLVPSAAVLVEIAPHGLLQAILKRSLPSSCKNIAITKRGHEDNAVFLLDAIGKLFIEGFSPQVQVLYPKVEFPVSTATPHLSHHVEWMHSDDWPITIHVNTAVKKAASCEFVINLHDDEHHYLRGHVVRGKIVYPFAAALVAVWDTLAMTLEVPKKTLSIQFSEVHLYSQPILHEQSQFKLSVSLHRGNGRFCISNGSSKVATGFIYVDNSVFGKHEIVNKQLNISSDEVYNNLFSRGYGFKDQFRTIYKVNESITEAELLYNDNWASMIDGLIQVNILKHSFSGVSQPCFIRELKIDVKEQLCDELADGTRLVEVKVDPLHDTTTCSGIKLSHIKFHDVTIETPDLVTLELIAPVDTTAKNTSLAKKSNDSKPFVLQISSIGDLNTLHWEQGVYAPEAGIKVKVQYAGLNASDVKRASGLIPVGDKKTFFGMDFSGVTESGDRVMGLVRNGAANTTVTALPNALWPVPAHWDLEDAATVPLAYAQAFYCLMIKNQLEKNMNILIHGGTGALGQAAIAISLAMGCRVLTTVADQSKKRFLQRLFPQLGDDVIGNSRDYSFGDVVLTATNGRGCDIILSCVKGYLRDVCLNCASDYGVTIDTSMLLDRDEYIYGMSHMTRCRTFMAIDFNSIFDNPAELKRVQELVGQGIVQEFVRPLSRVSYDVDQAPRAFRLLAASRHRGRVLLKFQDQQAPVDHGISCTPKAVHMIICDNSLVASQLGDKLVARGATNLRIHSIDSLQLAIKIRFWRSLGVKVEAVFGKLNTYQKITQLLCEALEPVEGIYIQITDENNVDYGTTLVNAFDRASRDICPQLKYFVVASSNTYIGKEACINRSMYMLPATFLILPNLNEVNRNNSFSIDEYTWNRITTDAIERALNSDQPILVARPKTEHRVSLAQQLSNIAGCLNFAESNVDLKLKDLQIENTEINSIQSYLHDTFNVTLETEDILELTKNKIQEIEANATENKFKEIKGLRKFFSSVDLDELKATTEFVQMETMVTSLIGDEIDLHDYLAIVPGMEGHHERFRLMCDTLKLPAVVLQPGLDFPNETPKELAIRYSKVILSNLGARDTFYLLGYEYGVMTALELAAILESHGKIGTVFCVGDSPKGIRAMIEQQLAEFPSEDALQAGIISHMFNLMAVEDTTLFKNVITRYSTWEERVSVSANSLIGRVSHSAQYILALINAAYARIKTARKHSFTSTKLRSKVVVLRPKSATPIIESLEQFSEQPVDVYEIEAPLEHATKDLRCTGIVNRYMSKELQTTYEHSNLCDSYTTKRVTI